MTFLQYAAVRLMLALSRLLPVSWLRALFAAGGRLYYRLDARRRNLTLANLEIAFPDKSPAERERLARAAYHHFCMVTADMILMLANRLDVAEIEAATDFKALDSHPLLAPDVEGGLLVITGHLGNWELLSHLCARRFRRPIAVVARELDNQLLEERLIMPMRQRFGTTVIHKKKAMFGIMRTLKDGGAVGLLLDQKSNVKEGVAVPFFGREALSMPSAAGLQLKYEYPAVGLFLVRRDDGSYTFECTEPLPLPPATLAPDERLRQATANQQKLIEDAIRNYPEQWFWMHDRWRLKTRKRKRRPQSPTTPSPATDR